jgi:hypothetical protein
MNNADAKPWYRETWPWLLIAGPALVVLAGIVTVWLAVASNDGLVADDYYKRGLAINQVLARDQVAAARGYAAVITYEPASGRVRVLLSGRDTPPALLLSVVHPTKAGEDRIVPLARIAADTYEGVLPQPMAGRWRLAIEDASRTWRLTADWRAPEETALLLGARS